MIKADKQKETGYLNLFLVSFLLFFASIAGIKGQTSQQGLLWKISREGSSDVSYIYGNMHVSAKIAFRLGEEFFQAISEVDKVALESNPIIWLDEIMGSDLAANYIGSYDFGRQNTNGFYKQEFRLMIPDNQSIAHAISSDHYFMNWLLYRENKGNSDFEEETFLDMFIYQAGAKNHKEVISLEDFKENTKYVELASLPDIEDKEPSQWFKKMTREKSYGELLEEAYRKQDLALIDSLQREVSSKNSYYWMIVKRNEKMIEKIDSIIKSGTTVFCGVGAAHLPGTDGILQLLTNKGYNVEALTVTFSDKARQLREAFDNKKIELTNYQPFQSELFTVNCPVNLYETPYSETQRQFFGPELTNGSHFTIKQISTLQAFKGLSINDYFVKIDSLLFENIPGKIESKVEIKGDFYTGYDITNKTKKGDYQRQKIFITPTHIIIFKMGGKDDFVLKNGTEFFKSIELKPPKENWKTSSTIHSDFSVLVPEYQSITNNTKITSLYGHPILEAWDSSDSSYYLVQRRSLFSFDYLEEDKFEIERIAEQFFLKMGLDTVKAQFVTKNNRPLAQAEGHLKDSTKAVKVNVISNGSYYFLLCAIGNNQEKSEKFFSSFKIDSPNYLFDFVEKTDSATMIKVTSNYLIPSKYEYSRMVAYDKRDKKNDTEDKSFKEKTKQKIFISENYERVIVNMEKMHIYDYFDNIDSLWNFKINEILAVSYNSRKSYTYSQSNTKPEANFVLLEKKSTIEYDLPVLHLKISDTATSKIIYKKLILKHGVIYEISAKGDSSYQLSKFAKNFLATAKPLDSVMGRSPFEDKASLFFNAIFGTDSLAREFAYQSAFKVRFKEKDIDSLKLAITKHKFPVKYLDTKEELIGKLISIEEFNDMVFAEELYKSAGDTAMFQIEILSSLAQKETKSAIETYKKLLEYDIPISGNSWGNTSLFYPFYYATKENSKNVRAVFPELLNYTFIEKYREGIIRSLAVSIDSQFISPTVYKRNVNQLLREAKIVLKEEISYSQSQQSKSNQGIYNSSRNAYKYRQNGLLKNYATLLLPYYKSKPVKEFFDKLEQIENMNLKNEVYVRMHRAGIPVDTSIWSKLANDPINKAILYKTLTKWNLVQLFPKEQQSQKDFALSILLSTSFNFEEDSLLYLDKRLVNDGKDSGYVYFFKTKTKGDEEWELNYIGYQPLDTNSVSVSPQIKKLGEDMDKTKPEAEIIDEVVNILNLRRRPYADGSEDDGGFYFY
ncbi:MAG: TraB/GumN family protein [Bacteroidales bacterium]|nr:TraB/GumN family protein [Bacteroidales bacterium]